MKRNGISNILYPLFLVTGAVGLIYQVLWVRLFGLVFGNTIFASSTVLAAFMAGLALGSYLSGTYLAKNSKISGLMIYAGIEVVVGIFGILMPHLKVLADGIYTGFYRAFDPSFTILTAFRFLISFIILVVPCILMGATLPVLVKYASDVKQDQKGLIGKLYGINTVGAVWGCLIGGFYLVGHLGLTRTSIVAAAFNFMVAVIAFILYRSSKNAGPNIENKTLKGKHSVSKVRKEEKVDIAGMQRNKQMGRTLIVVYALSGFAALALEVAWVRAMVWIMSMDSYAYAAMLSVILAGIGLGSLIHTFAAKRIKDERNFLVVIQAAIGVSVLFSIFMIQHSAAIKGFLDNILSNMGGLRFIFGIVNPITVSQLLLAALVFLIPSIFMGIAFPAITGLYTGICGNIGKGVGNIYSANTFGAILGSLGMGFVIMPALGLQKSIAVMACIYFLTALVLWGSFSMVPLQKRALRLAGMTVLAAALVLLTNTNSVDFVKTTLVKGDMDETEKLLYFKENATGDVLVKHSKNYGNEMLIDGVQVASDGDFDLHSHIYPAHLMSLLKKDPKDILVVAFGCGGTSGSILKYDDVDRLDVVEICSGVVEPAKQFFSKMNSNVFDNPKLNLIIQDGKNYVHMTDKNYDIIYSGPIHPQSNQGSAALYTKDYFEECKSKLKDGGFQCLWLPMHMSSAEDFKIIVKTFMDVYPYVSMWGLPETDTSVGHPHLIGSMDPVYPDYQAISEKLKRPGIAEDLKRLNETAFSKPYEFISQFMMGEDSLKKLVGSLTKLNTDDLPVVEYYKRPNNYIASTAASKAMLLADTVKYMENPYRYVNNVPENEKAELKKQLDRLYEGNKALIMGHYYFTAKHIISLDVDKYIQDNYSKAYTLLPESTFLRNFFDKTK